MSDTIRKDGLTDEERAELEGDARFTGLLEALNKLAAERLTHAETRAKHSEWSVNKERRHAGEKALLRARAEKAEAERDRLRAALEAMRASGDRLHDDLVLYHAAADVIPEWNRARALLGEVKP